VQDSNSLPKIYVRYFNLNKNCDEFSYQLFHYAYACPIYLKMTA